MGDGFMVRVAGIPKAQPRPRAFVRGKRAGVYDPGTADGWKTVVREETRKIWNGSPYGGPLHVTLGFSMPRPKTHLTRDGKVKPGSPIYSTSRPDSDNLAKAVLDALTDLGVWRDDSQVSHLEVAKTYSLHPGATIVVAPCVCTDHITQGEPK